MKKKNDPRVVSRNGTSLKGRTNSLICNGLGVGGMRDLIVKLAMI